MKAFLQACTINWVLALSACGGNTAAEGNSDGTKSAPIDIPINPLPLSERSGSGGIDDIRFDAHSD